MLLNSTEFSEKLEFSLRSSEDTVIVLSAFTKASALKWMLENSKAKSIKVIARWRKHDLICGASDFECYKICRDANVDFGISLNLHGKVFCIDQHIFVGSANLTTRGMALSRNFNDEFGIGFTAGESDSAKIESYLQNVIWINDDLANRMQQEIESPRTTSTVSEEEWSPALNEHLFQPIRHLWIHELLFTTPTDLLNFDAENEHHLHDYELLGLNLDSLNEDTLAQNFRRLNSYKWLQNILAKEGSLSFGAVSSRLHNSILDDPLPYRRGIKELVANLYAWFGIMTDDYEITRPRHSQIISLKNSKDIS